jgi:hypothetical protein
VKRSIKTRAVKDCSCEATPLIRLLTNKGDFFTGAVFLSVLTGKAAYRIPLPKISFGTIPNINENK